jgi:hypothetical protein
MGNSFLAYIHSLKASHVRKTCPVTSVANRHYKRKRNPLNTDGVQDPHVFYNLDHWVAKEPIVFVCQTHAGLFRRTLASVHDSEEADQNGDDEMGQLFLYQVHAWTGRHMQASIGI